MNQTNTRRTRRRTRRPFSSEVLETRCLLTASYADTVLAQTGQFGLTAIGADVSINDLGAVAFQGTTASDNGLFAGDGSAAFPVSEINAGFGTGTRRFSPYVQINDANQIVAQDQVSGPSSLIRIWNPTTGGNTIVAEGGAAFTSSPLSSVLIPVENNNGAVDYQALMKSASDNNQYLYSTAGSPVNLGVSPIALRPVLSDNGKVVYRDGNATTSPIQVNGISIANTSTFTALGESPGISNDGSVTAFYGVDINGPGIFIYANNSILRVAGGSVDTFSSFVADSRVGVNRIGDGPVQVVFEATGSDGQLGIHVTTLVANKSSPSQYLFSSDQVVAEVGGSINGLSGAITGLSIYDPINTDGQVAFEASFGTAGQAVVRAMSYLYDFSGKATVSPVNLIYHDQYDDKIGTSSFNFSGQTLMGGAACGPSSLDMALQEVGLPVSNSVVSSSIQTIFNNTTDADSRNNRGFDFNMSKAASWMQSQMFRSAYGVNVGSVVSGADSWANIDSNLYFHHPVILSTVLSQVAYSHQGGGHDILLLGVGTDPSIQAALKQLTPLSGIASYSGKYYIVADPAGDYFANPTQGGLCNDPTDAGGHYGQIGPLARQQLGENNAGGFAVYPAEVLDAMTLADMKTLTLKPVTTLVVTADCPVSLLITDPSGNQTGYESDGTFVQNVPLSTYTTDDSDTDMDPDPPAPDPNFDVSVNAPVSGNYTIQVTGTAAGPYSIYTEYDSAGGTPSSTDLVTGSATAGSVASFVFTVPSSGATAQPVIVASGQTWHFPAGTGTSKTVAAVPGLTIQSGGTAVVDAAASSASRQLLDISGPGLSVAGSTGNWTGVLDVANNDLDITAGESLATVTDQARQGYATGSWTGTGGIISSLASADSTHLMSVGVVQNNQGGANLFSSTNSFDGTTPAAGDVLVKYTYAGDANLDGKVDGSDYSQIDAGYSSHGTLTGWFNGDFNYDGVIDGSDYALIDNAFNNQQTAIPAAQFAAPSERFAPSTVDPALARTAMTRQPSRRVPVPTAWAPPAPAVFSTTSIPPASSTSQDRVDQLDERGE